MRFFMVAFVGVLSVPSVAWAYIDPNTGGMILQMLAPILAAIAGAWIMAKDYIKRMFYSLIGRKPKSDQSTDGHPVAGDQTKDK